MSAQNNTQNAKLSRRDFLKGSVALAAALVAAPAAIQAAAPSEALAGEYGTYTYNYTPNGTCHVFVPYSQHKMLPVYGKNAYLTNGTTPDGITGPFPTTAIENNALITAVDGGYEVTVELKNDAFALLAIDDYDSTGAAHITSKAVDYYSELQGAYRIYTLKIVMPELGGQFVFGASEHAKVSFLDQDKSWNITIQAYLAS